MHPSIARPPWVRILVLVALFIAALIALAIVLLLGEPACACEPLPMTIVPELSG